jgi:hypothetical protein
MNQDGLAVAHRQCIVYEVSSIAASRQFPWDDDAFQLFSNAMSSR